MVMLITIVQRYHNILRISFFSEEIDKILSDRVVIGYEAEKDKVNIFLKKKKVRKKRNEIVLHGMFRLVSLLLFRI